MHLTEEPRIEVLQEILDGYYPDIKGNDRQELSSYYNECQSSEGVVICRYSKKMYNGIPLGRYYPDSPLMYCQVQDRRTRTLLFGVQCLDIDIKNAQPTLASDYFKKYINNPTTTHLDNYVKYRNAIIESTYVSELAIERYNKMNKKEITKKDIVKCMYTIGMFQGTLNALYETYSISADEIDTSNFWDFRNEIKTNIELLYSTDSNQVRKHIEAITKQYEKEKKELSKGALFAILMQDVECQVVVEAMDQWKALCPHHKIQSYIFDGFVVDKMDEIAAEISLGMINERIKDKLKYNVEFIVKPFSDGYPRAVPCTRDIAFFRWLQCHSVVRYSYILETYLKDFLNTNDGLYKYCDGIWQSADATIVLRDSIQGSSKEIAEMISRYAPKDQVKKLLLKSESPSTYKPALDLVMANIMQNSTGIVSFDEKPNLLNCLNKTIDLDTMEIMDHKREDYLTLTTNVHVNPELICIETYQSVAQVFRLWFDQFDDCEDVVKYLMTEIACAMHGKNTTKALVLIGRLSSNGKTTMCHWLQRVFGTYFGTMKVDYFTDESKSANNASPFTLNIRSKRMTVVNECDDNLTLDHGKFKMLTSQGDKIVARDLFKGSKHIVEFINQSTLFFISNSNLNFTENSNAIMRRLTYYNFANCFSAGEQKFIKETDKAFRKLDIDFEDKLKSMDDLLFHALLYLYKECKGNIDALKKPKSIQDFNTENLEELNTVQGWSERMLVYDESVFDRFNHDDHVVNIFPKINGKPRMLTLEYLYKYYTKDCPGDEVQYKVFVRMITNVYSNIYEKKRTSMFGGAKYYIRDLRYVGFDQLVN